MAKKVKQPEHENLERWMVSYADFVTLLFATFVVLYALSQVDISDFKTLEQSIQNAFAAPSIMQGSDGVMQPGSDTLFDQTKADSLIAPLMMEYMSSKYENQSMNEIEKSINDSAKIGELDGVEAIKTDKGLLIRFSGSCLFAPGSASLTPNAKKKLDQVGAIIAKKFILHNMRVEGHTDNNPTSGSYPSNWELSSARSCSIIRYYISKFHFMPEVFTAVGFAQTRPIASNSDTAGKAKNRRVEILILKNKYKSQESATDILSKLNKTEQNKLQQERMDAINSVYNISPAAQKLSKGDKKALGNTIILNEAYNKELKRISTETSVVDSKTRSKMNGELKPPANTAGKIKVFK